MSTSDRKVLFLRDMPTDLVREAKAVAARRGQTLATVVAEALSRSLGVMEATPGPGQELLADMTWYRKNQAKLVERYGGQYVAIVDGAVVDHAKEFQTVAHRMFARYGNRSIYMPRVQAGEREVRVRSPRRPKS